MLIDTGLTIAYKCSSCGAFEFFNVSLFKLLNKKRLYLTCRCKKTFIIIEEEDRKNYRIKLPCIGCGNEHMFILSRKKMLFKDINIFCCPETGLQQCFIGRDAVVRQKIDNLEKELDELIDMFGFDNYFKNTRVMFDTLNKIHDVAEQGNLYCECGNNDIELVLFPDKIHLKCKKCPGSRMLYASSNEDLKNILIDQQFILLSSISGIDKRKSDSFLKK